MTAKDAIRSTVEMCRHVVSEYVKDLTDKDLFVRSVPGSNHIAWQLGHLIGSDNWMLEQLGRPGVALPANFAESHSKETSTSDDPAKFFKKADYERLAAATREATLSAITATPDADLDKPGPEEMRQYCPTVGAVLMLLGTHWMMHAGQFVPIRRKLGKPALF